jgi:hypothetical protein
VLPDPGPEQERSWDDRSWDDRDWDDRDRNDRDWDEQPGDEQPWQDEPPAPYGSRAGRAGILTALFALVLTGFAVAPYLSLVPIGIAVLLLRTGSWAAESARDRKWRRGRTRWYDGVLTALSTPWYLLIATIGTVVLMACAAVLAFVAGIGYLLFRGPQGPALGVMGAVLGLALWCGPGSLRVRRPTRELAGRLSIGVWPTRVTVAVLAAGAVLCGYVAFSGGVDWSPAAAAPWAPGTVLGGLLGF